MREHVTLAYVHDVDVSHSFHDCLTRLLFYDAGTHERIIGGGGLIKMRCGTDGLPQARNMVVRRLLDSDTKWLVWLDTDMGFAPDTVEQLMTVADATARPIVGGLCFAQKETTLDNFGGYRAQARCTVLDWVERGDGTQTFMGRAWYPPNTLVRCAATGSACILIHRSVFERIEEQHGETWYDRARGDDGLPLGEDVSFCLRAAACGFPVHVHTGVRTTHHKPVWLGEEDFWTQAVAPPAIERTAVLVPVLDRPHHAAPFMASLRASTGLATAYAVVEPGDPAGAAWADSGAVVLDYEGDRDEAPHTFAEKVNAGYGRTEEPWLFLVGSDVRFRPGWLDQAQYAAGVTGARVIGTNDLANPRTMRGEHATHLLIGRDYVDDVGASWDGPKVVAHEGYSHWFVDDEIVTAARQRETWAMALGSLVEHLHPIVGKADDDDVYQLGRANAADDKKLFERRARRYLRRPALVPIEGNDTDE